MAERGARPNVSPARRRLLRAAGVLFTPLLPDDYLELINPLWSSRELRGRIEAIEPETADCVTVVIRPGWVWAGTRAGPVPARGRRRRRRAPLARLLADLRSRAPRRVHLDHPEAAGHRQGVAVPGPQPRGPGTIVRLGGVEGDFTLPDPPPRSLLFVSAGSGITPIMSMLRDLDRRDGLRDVVHVHSARTAADVVFGAQLRALADRHAGYRLHLQLTGAAGRLAPTDLEPVCPDWRDRETFASGPGAMLDALSEHWEQAGPRAQLRMERFQPVIDGHARRRPAGRSRSPRAARGRCPTAPSRSSSPASTPGSSSPTAAAWASAAPASAASRSGRVRDLRTGKVSGQPGEIVRTCINAPEGPVEIAL